MDSNEATEPKLFTFSQLKKMTDDFSVERKLGEGTFAVVYRGVQENGEEVAVKLLRETSEKAEEKAYEEFQKELDNLRILNHDNIVRLVGYCYETHRELAEYNGRQVLAEKTCRALCFEYLCNGSLGKYLSDESVGLDWHQRYKIIKGTWEGLRYLHKGLQEPVLHLDLKPDNILLDHNMMPKLADFGLSKLFVGEHTMATQTVKGTFGYMPLEYFQQNIVSIKSDIYSLGVVMIEIITGTKRFSYFNETTPEEFSNKVNEKWRIRMMQSTRSSPLLEAYCEQVQKCTEIALKCIEHDRKQRPDIVNIIEDLNMTETMINNLRIDPGLSMDTVLPGPCSSTTNRSRQAHTPPSLPPVKKQDSIGLDRDEITEYLPSAGDKKRMRKKRRVQTLSFAITNDICIEVDTYALTSPTTRGTNTRPDSLNNIRLKTERSFIRNDTGALLQDPHMRFQMHKGMVVKFSSHELSEVKKVSSHDLRLLGFKPLDCLKDYHNLRPSTFIYPSDEHISGSTLVFVALHSSMLRLRSFALAFYGNSTRPQRVALVAQKEVTSSAGQVEPPGMHMIYLPYSDDIRYPEEVLVTSNNEQRAKDGLIEKASNLLKCIHLENFSVCQFANPALGEDEMPDIKDKTLPDAEGLARTIINEFKASVYQEAEAGAAKASRGDASKKRKAITDAASLISAAYDWAKLADNGMLMDMTVMELKSYLTAHGLRLSGNKEALISRILTHLGK